MALDTEPTHSLRGFEAPINNQIFFGRSWVTTN